MFWVIQLASQWGERAEHYFKELTALRMALPLVKGWYLEELEIDFAHAEEMFYFWRDYSTSLMET